MPGENGCPAEPKTAEQKPCDDPEPLNTEVRNSLVVAFPIPDTLSCQKASLHMVQTQQGLNSG